MFRGIVVRRKGVNRPAWEDGFWWFEDHHKDSFSRYFDGEDDSTDDY